MKNMFNRLKEKQNKKGFTLVEIIVVLVILAILAAIAIPAVLGYVEDARKSQYIAEARSIYLVVQTEEAKWRSENNIGEYNGDNSNHSDYSALYRRLMDKRDVADNVAVENKDGENIVSKKTGLPEVYMIHQISDGTTYLYSFKWKSNNGHIIDAEVYKNKKVRIQTIDGKTVS